MVKAGGMTKMKGKKEREREREREVQRVERVPGRSTRCDTNFIYMKLGFPILLESLSNVEYEY